MPGHIQIKGHFDLDATLQSGQTFRWRKEHDCYTGVIFGNFVLIKPTVDGLEFTSFPETEDAFIIRLSNYLGLDDDLGAIYQSICVDDHLKSVVDRYLGMRILRQDPWECLVSFICSAWSNVNRVSRIVENLSSRFGQPILVDGNIRAAFPAAEELASTDEQTLRSLGLGFRAKYIIASSRHVAEGRIDLTSLRNAPFEKVLDTISSLPGIGDKVANCIMLFSLGQRSAFPVDLWIRRVLSEQYLGDEGSKMSMPMVRRWAQDYFGPYAGYANHYLFHGRRLAGRRT